MTCIYMYCSSVTIFSGLWWSVFRPVTVCSRPSDTTLRYWGYKKQSTCPALPEFDTLGRCPAHPFMCGISSSRDWLLFKSGALLISKWLQCSSAIPLLAVAMQPNSSFCIGKGRNGHIHGCYTSVASLPTTTCTHEYIYVQVCFLEHAAKGVTSSLIAWMKSWTHTCDITCRAEPLFEEIQYMYMWPLCLHYSTCHMTWSRSF